MEHFLTFLLAAICAGAGGYLGAYLKKKGENLATHEDIDKLLDQVSAVTQATKEIEAKISNDVWERQKRWEVKREALFETLKELGTTLEALSNLACAFKAARLSGQAASQTWQDQKVEAINQWNSAKIAFYRAELVVAVMCSQDVRAALDAIDLTIGHLSADTLTDGQLYFESLPTLVSQESALKATIRKELHVDG